MRRTIHKLFWAWEFDKEEQWLNQMAAKGLALVYAGLCTYAFEECVPGEYEIRLELLPHRPTHAESQQYIKFVEETGAEYLGGMAGWVYFRKKKSLGQFHLHSDYTSRIQHLTRILVLLSALASSQLFVGVFNIVFYFNSSLHRYHPNLVLGCVALACGLLITIGLLQLYRQRRKLQKEKQVFE